jgi:hypothetical protein
MFLAKPSTSPHGYHLLLLKKRYALSGALTTTQRITMNILKNIKHAFLVLTFISLSPLQGIPRPQLNVDNGIAEITAGALLVTLGLCILNEIPLTSLDEIALSFRHQLSKQNLKKVYLARTVEGYTIAGLGALTSLCGICTVLAAATRR